MFKNDSRKIKKGDTFIAIGKGINYIEDAKKNGAKRIIIKDEEYLKKYLKRYYYSKIKHIKLIGITGTNGKTTSAYLIYQSLNLLGIKCGYIGTLGYYRLGKHIKLNNTTPDLLTIYELLMESRDLEYVVMEVSSQGLSYGRVDTLKFSYAIFTNLTQDHLDYHKTMENYCLAKQLLFKKLKGIGIVNIDDFYHNYFHTDKMITYGMKKSDYQIKKINTNMNETRFMVNNNKYKTKLIGEYNIYNLTVVIIILKCLKISYLDIFKVISKLSNVSGRMDTIKYNDNLIVIDYAHTPDAVEKIIKCMKNIGNRIITIIGCGGNRDKTKRPIMGGITTKYSDYAIFTSDNPRLENASSILNDIVNKLDTFNYEIVENRSLAINKGIQMLTKNDILLILGKGCEDYQIIGNQKIPFSDKEEVLKIIGE